MQIRKLKNSKTRPISVSDLSLTKALVIKYRIDVLNLVCLVDKASRGYSQKTGF
jgi:hypothetical protein